jgi:hypothetical protein
MITNSFRGDIEFIHTKLKNKEKFAFSKYADGEFRILANQHINLLAKANGEFKYDPNDISDSLYRQELVHSFQYQHQNYYVGIGCKCCMGDTSFNWMKDNSGQPPLNLTWANIFVNGNYKYYQKNIIPLYSNYEVVMVVNHKAKLDSLPFNVIKDFRVGTNAYKEDYNLFKEINYWVNENNIKNKLFLFCAGPYGNILTWKLHQNSQNNTYIDVGSTLDPYLELGKTRGYLKGADTLSKMCIW